MTSKSPYDLQAGDIFHYSDSEVTALQAPEPHEDMFGRQQIKVWCSTEGREGFLLFGPGAVDVELVEEDVYSVPSDLESMRPADIRTLMQSLCDDLNEREAGRFIVGPDSQIDNAEYLD